MVFIFQAFLVCLSVSLQKLGPANTLHFVVRDVKKVSAMVLIRLISYSPGFYIYSKSSIRPLSKVTNR